MVEFRKVTEGDLSTIYRWRNDPIVRKNSFNQEEISWEEHLGYWSARMKNSNAYSFIVVSENEDVGLVRLDREGDACEVHILIAPDKHGRGLGKAAIAKTKDMAGGLNIKKLIARVKDTNVASKKIFTENGFLEKNDTYTCDL